MSEKLTVEKLAELEYRRYVKGFGKEAKCFPKWRQLTEQEKNPWRIIQKANKPLTTQ